MDPHKRKNKDFLWWHHIVFSVALGIVGLICILSIMSLVEL